MALTNSYLNSTKNLESIINSVLGARAPEKFTTKFLEDLGFKSSNDRLIIGVFKSLGLLDENGQPLQRYFDFLDQTQSKKILAQGIQEAYEDLFNLKRDAQNFTNQEVKNKLKTLTQGQKSESVISCMAMTFTALCGIADWDFNFEDNNYSDINKTNFIEEKPTNTENKSPIELPIKNSTNPKMNLHYNIQIHLPETTNMAVYDAIFQSLKKHLI